MKETRDRETLPPGHAPAHSRLFQGFVPVLIFREVLLRRGILKPGAWSVAVLLFMTLGLSASYELLEWQTAVWTGSSADAFLGS